MKMIPLNKQSKKEQKKYHARSRRDWNGLKPTTRVVKNKKIYDRKKMQKDLVIATKSNTLNLLKTANTFTSIPYASANIFCILKQQKAR